MIGNLWNNIHHITVRSDVVYIYYVYFETQQYLYAANINFLHHISYSDIDPNADYPPILVTTSTRDDRVHPGHARKFVKVR
jgi:hypothetical protein